MAGRIPKDFIDDLITRSDIVDVIDSRVKLKKAGRNYQACCPFHNEKTPSFSVSPEKQFYHCFGCGATGNVITFLMEYERLEFVEAIEDLANMYGLEVPRDTSISPQQAQQQKGQREQDYAVMQQVAQFYEHQLKHHSNSNMVIDYLKSRGLSGKIVKQWGIGYAPKEWDAVLKHFANNNTERDRLLALKLVNQNDKQKTFDFFRHRVMFPIHDKRGRAIAFGGRTIDDNGPKYLNSPETRIFHKGHELYGLYQARKANRKLDRLLVVEGYMDVVALSQYEINYAVAALGTATTPEHIQSMFKATQEIVCCYDGDRAGRDAANRAMENALPYLQDGKVMKFLFLPDGEDPDSMVRKIGKQAFEELISTAKPLSSFLFDYLIDKHTTETIEARAALKAEATPLIKQIVGDNQRQMMFAELARICGETPAQVGAAKPSKNIKKQNHDRPTKVALTPLRMMIRLLLENPSIAPEVSVADLSLLHDENITGLKMLKEIFSYCESNHTANTGILFEAFREHPQLRHLNTLSNTEIDENIDLKAEYLACYKSLVKMQVDARLAALSIKSELTPAEQQELTLLIQAK